MFHLIKKSRGGKIIWFVCQHCNGGWCQNWQAASSNKPTISALLSYQPVIVVKLYSQHQKHFQLYLRWRGGVDLDGKGRVGLGCHKSLCDVLKRTHWRIIAWLMVLGSHDRRAFNPIYSQRLGWWSYSWNWISSCKISSNTGNGMITFGKTRNSLDGHSSLLRIELEVVRMLILTLMLLSHSKLNKSFPPWPKTKPLFLINTYNTRLNYI